MSLRTLHVALMLALLAPAGAARADLWAYVDEQGRSHVASRQVDARYKLFFKGETTLDAPSADSVERARAADALGGTALYARATNPSFARPYEALIATHAHANGLDPALVKAVVAVESAFEAHAISPKGAVGLMQVLPQTGERYGLAGDARRSVAEKLSDPATNLRIGTRYLRDLLARFANDMSLALAAYNAGEGTIATHANHVPPFTETREYVRLVRMIYALYRPEPTTSAAPVRIIGASRSPAVAAASAAGH